MSVPITHYQKGTKRIPAIRLRTILRHRGFSATHLRTLGNVLRRAFPFEKCLPPGGIFTSIALIIAKPPSGGRKLSFREAVLPLMYLVKEDGLQLGRCRPLNPMRTFRIADVDRSDWRPRREPQQGGAELWLMSVRQAAVAAVTC
jgi:hypothetical protein